MCDLVSPSKGGSSKLCKLQSPQQLGLYLAFLWVGVENRTTNKEFPWLLLFLLNMLSVAMIMKLTTVGGQIFRMGRILEVSSTPREGWVKFAGSTSCRRNTVPSPSCAKTMRPGSVCISQEWKRIRRGW